MPSRPPRPSRFGSSPASEAAAPPPGKRRSLTLLALATLLALSLWFSASAVAPQLAAGWGLGAGAQAWLTMSVQLGFVAGALASAAATLADRVPARGLLAGSALAGALFNGVFVLFEPGFGAALALRFATGATLAGVYPPAMKLVATWTRGDRGLWIGVLVGALTVGSATPHLLGAVAALGAEANPRTVMAGSSLLALAGALIALAGVRRGPYLARAARFDWRRAAAGLRDRPLRLANFGYFGHMWELYAVWTWLPLLLIESYRAAALPPAAARFAGFAVVALGGLGSVVFGRLADRWGRTRSAELSLWISGVCALVAGALAGAPLVLTALALLWGFVVVADSAQFSAAASELADARYVGTALTMQTALGFLLTVVSIQLIPLVRGALGWSGALPLLALGPAVGIWAMRTLRAAPEAKRLASGRG